MHYLITRHIGALQWMQQNVTEPFIHWTHLSNTALLNAGDTVLGTLPIQNIADLNRRGVHYFHLQIELPEHLRGCELSSHDLTTLKAELIEYVAIAVVPDRQVLKMAEERDN